MSYDWKERDPAGYERWASGYGFLEADMMYPKGKQFWNDERTEGYELTEDCMPSTPCRAEQFKALGKALPAVAGKPFPRWLAAQLSGFPAVTTPPNSKENSDDHS